MAETKFDGEKFEASTAGAAVADTPPAVDQDVTPDEAQARLHAALEFDEQIASIDNEIALTESEIEEAKATLKGLLAKRETMIFRMRRTMNGEPTKQAELPFDGQPAANDNGWRRCSIDELDITDALKEKLRGADINTIGDLANFTNDETRHRGKGLAAIKGIGESAAGKIEDAMTAFWRNYATSGSDRPLVADSATVNASEPAPKPEKAVDSK